MRSMDLELLEIAMNNALLLLVMTWLTENATLLIDLLHALVPVLAIVVVGYAIHAVHKRAQKDPK